MNPRNKRRHTNRKTLRMVRMVRKVRMVRMVRMVRTRPSLVVRRQPRTEQQPLLRGGYYCGCSVGTGQCAPLVRRPGRHGPAVLTPPPFCTPRLQHSYALKPRIVEVHSPWDAFTAVSFIHLSWDFVPCSSSYNRRFGEHLLNLRGYLW
jgi:hypothetical protein